MKNKFLSLAGLLVVWIVVYSQLQVLSEFTVYSFLGMDRSSHLTSALSFFLFETPKVLMLLILVVFCVGIVRSYFSPERTKKFLGGKKHLLGNILSATLGIVTPFCSCSAIPLFLGFVEGGIPLGVTFSFLIAAPMINEVAIVLLFGLFGWKVAVLYVATGWIIAVLSGYIIGVLKLERYVEEWVYSIASKHTFEEERPSFADRIDAGTGAVKDVVGKIWIYIILGIAVGAGIHGYVPEQSMAAFMGRSAWWSVPLSVLLGIPMYSNAAGIIPIVQALLEKGASLGTVLAFMMSVIGLSLPETIILKKVLKLPLIFSFVGIVGFGILIVGYIFNIIY